MDFRPSRTWTDRLAGYPTIHPGPRPTPAPVDETPIPEISENDLRDLLAELDAIAAE